MRIKVDLESDALYFRICEASIDSSDEVDDGIVVDYDSEGKVVGIEILRLKERFKLEDLMDLKLELPTVVQSVQASA